MKIDKRRLNKIITNLKKDGGKATYPFLKLNEYEEDFLEERGIIVTRSSKKVNGVYSSFDKQMITLQFA